MSAEASHSAPGASTLVGAAAQTPADEGAAGREGAPATPRDTATLPPWLVRSLLPVAVVLAALAAGALMLAYTAQQRLKVAEAELVRRQDEATQVANEARLLARQAETGAREASAKMALLEARLAETTMQRSQFEDLLQSLARSRDENVLADIEAALRVAQQQSAITGSADPLVQVLRQADERLARYAQPRLERVRRAVGQDLERIRAAGSPDIAALAGRLDEMMRQVDELPLLVTPPQGAARRSGVPAAAGAGSSSSAPTGAPSAPVATGTAPRAGAPAPTSTATSAANAAESPSRSTWPFFDPLRKAWNNLVTHTWNETRALVRVTRIDDPQAMLIAPEQAYFLRENVKLRLLNARLALMSRQFDVAQSDLRESLTALERYFDRSARRTVLTMEALRQVMAQARTVAVPRPDATLAAIATAGAGR